MTAKQADADLAALYRETRQRLGALVSELGDAELAAMVPGCPGWSVRDVLAHLTAVAQDVPGRPPDRSAERGRHRRAGGEVPRHRGT